MKYTLCDGCPCLNSGDEYGSDCNLGCDSEYRRLRVDSGWHQCSTKCDLLHIAFRNGTYVPPQETWDTEEDPPPPPPPPPAWLIEKIMKESMITDIFEELGSKDR